jgi:hypothetical protein
MKNHLEQQITQFIPQIGNILARDSIGDLVSFLDGVRRNRLERLF